ncbi:MAG TPA: threonine synthase [Thermoanaerobaculia bacterium]|nr:threonine synthase [Thermoanaerobaculia bacterium]
MRLTGTRDPSLRVSFKEAVERNLPGEAAGGGLFVPAELAPWDDVGELLALSWPQRCVEILDRLLAPEYARQELVAIVAEAFDFPLPLVPVATGTASSPPASAVPPSTAAGGSGAGRCFALELFHGPSLAFKDFGARFLAAVVARLPARRARTVLTATSGDTGAAVAAAFWRRPGCRVVALYPAGRIAPLQERQLACLGDNVVALAVAGSFDDCQRLVKACFADPVLTAELALTSANSINVARLVAQILYYFEALAQLRRLAPGGAAPVIAVPSGNFGNLCAGLYARALGLPVAALVAATNANRTVPDYLDGGRYSPRPSVATLSNAMDVGDPSNWERIAHLYRHDRGALRDALRWGSLDEPATAAALRRLWAAGYQADPHGAVAWGILERVRRPGETGIFLATAHPAKFQFALAALGLAPALPPALRELQDRPLRRESLPADERALKARLLAGRDAGSGG